MLVRRPDVVAVETGVNGDGARLLPAEHPLVNDLYAPEAAHSCITYGGISFAPRNATPEKTPIATTNQSRSSIMLRILDAASTRAKGRRSRSERSNRTLLAQASATPSSVPIANVTPAAATPIASCRNPARSAG